MKEFLDKGDDVMMKMLKDLSLEELKELYSANNHFRNEVFERKIADADFFADDVLRCFRNMRYVDYSISGYGYSYMKVGYQVYKDFLNAVLKTNKEYCLNIDEAKIERVISKLDFYDDARCGYEDISDDKFDKLERWIEDCVNSSASAIVDYVKTIYEEAYEVNDDDLLFYQEDCPSIETDGRYIYEEVKYA